MINLARRTAAAAALTAVTASGLVALGSTSAQAATEVSTQVRLDPSHRIALYKGRIGFAAYTNLAGGSGYPQDDADNDHVYLQRKLPGGSWKKFKGSDGLSEYWSMTAYSNATYRACYPGGTTTSYDGAVTVYKPSCSPAYTTKVRFGITSKGWSKGSRDGFKGTVSPKFTGKVKYQAKKGRKWVTLRAFKLNRGKTFNVTMRARKTTEFRVIVPATKKNATQWTSYKLYVWRTPAGTTAKRLVAQP